jgi:bacterioferritin-associated ferredoxin
MRAIPTLQSKPLQIKDFLAVLGQSFTGIFTCLAARSETGHCSVNARPLLANATSADAYTLMP